MAAVWGERWSLWIAYEAPTQWICHSLRMVICRRSAPPPYFVMRSKRSLLRRLPAMRQSLYDAAIGKSYLCSALVSKVEAVTFSDFAINR